MLFRNGRFPSPWKIAQVVLIPKVRKNLNMPSHYRPICLLSAWGKRKRSTVSAIENIKRYVSQADQEGQVTCLISLDVANAFNSVNWNLLKEKVLNLAIPFYIKNTIFDFLKDRFISNKGIEIPYNIGVPQGSCPGPILWNIFINDRLKIDVGTDMAIQAFADDIVILMKASATFHFKQKSIRPLNMVHEWISNHGLSINYDKSKFILITQKRYSHIPSIRMNNKKLVVGVDQSSSQSLGSSFFSCFLVLVGPMGFAACANGITGYSCFIFNMEVRFGIAIVMPI
ncbi:retrovirus-related Pol polyprotein from type-1 retrotransposable element R1 [Caerostris darwini]|uniref:Retrovirus-related Pol polyprotein from type-1 retrotransposable element R1 n=1 Tax=Caerostris darwini TaxID=1538125 RepID=A0AAV4RMZ3_9ARAC|nr:retrovirus-related Pol polyprotein from type-1 retrotransposable element R1 [Caerostris darwini]